MLSKCHVSASLPYPQTQSAPLYFYSFPHIPLFIGPTTRFIERLVHHNNMLYDIGFFFFFLLLLLFFCFVSLLYASHLPRFRNAIITWQPTPIHLFHLRVNSFASLLSRTSFLVRYLGQVAVVLNLSENRTCILMMF